MEVARGRDLLALGWTLCVPIDFVIQRLSG